MAHVSTNQPKKKILYLITKSNFGGAQRYVYDLATAYKDKGYEVAVAAGGTGEKGARPGKLIELLEAKGLRTIFIREFMRNVSILSDIRLIMALWRLVKKERPDILHVTSSKAGGAGALIGRLLGVPKIIFTSHGLTFAESWRSAWQRLLIKFGTWITIMLSNQSIMISKETYEIASQMLFAKNKVALVHNGIHKIDYRDRTAARQALAAIDPSLNKEDLYMIGTIGELHPNKNQSVLIEVLAKLNQRTSNNALVIIGAGELEAELIEQAKRLGVAKEVHLLGFIPDAACLIKAFDVFVLPSLKEGLPYVLLEAGYAGRPVIASDIAGNRDIIEHEKTGLLAEPAVEPITSALAKLKNNPDLAKELGHNLFKKVAKTFSISSMVEETENLYRS